MKPRPPAITYLLNGVTWNPTSNVIPIEVARAIAWYGVIVVCTACLHRAEACLLIGKTKPDLKRRRSSGLVCLKCGKKRAKVIESLPATHEFSTILDPMKSVQFKYDGEKWNIIDRGKTP